MQSKGFDPCLHANKAGDEIMFKKEKQSQKKRRMVHPQLVKYLNHHANKVRITTLLCVSFRPHGIDCIDRNNAVKPLVRLWLCDCWFGFVSIKYMKFATISITFGFNCAKLDLESQM